MKLMLLSDLSTMNGVKINADYVLIPKKYYKKMLEQYPEALYNAEQFFYEHDRAKAVVIKDLEKETK